METKVHFSVRLTKTENEILQKKADVLQISKNKFLRKIILTVDENDLKKNNENLIEIIKISRHISNNLNQIAKKLNSKKDLEEGYNYLEELRELWQFSKQ